MKPTTSTARANHRTHSDAHVDDEGIPDVEVEVDREALFFPDGDEDMYEKPIDDPDELSNLFREER